MTFVRLHFNHWKVGVNRFVLKAQRSVGWSKVNCWKRPQNPQGPIHFSVCQISLQLLRDMWGSLAQPEFSGAVGANLSDLADHLPQEGLGDHFCRQWRPCSYFCPTQHKRKSFSRLWSGNGPLLLHSLTARPRNVAELCAYQEEKAEVGPI